ncbi:MAG: hypothetical protein IKR56_08130 [Lachnospiraceae bacterium]|nr:hypothetical protein [Lachnospiraceae bacterium]
MIFIDNIKNHINAKKTDRFKKSGILRYFSYSFGSMGEGMKVFVIAEEGEFASMTYKNVSMEDGREVGSSFLIPLNMLNKLKALIASEEIFLWDGFNKNNSVIATGHSFDLKADFDNQTIKAHGMVMMPPGYKEKHEVLVNFLEGLVKTYYREISEA